MVHFWLIYQSIEKNSLTSENDSITLENFEFVHFRLSHLNNRVVILRRILHLQLIWRLFPLKDRRREIFLTIENKEQNVRFSLSHMLIFSLTLLPSD